MVKSAIRVSTPETLITASGKGSSNKVFPTSIIIFSTKIIKLIKRMMFNFFEFTVVSPFLY